MPHLLLCVTRSEDNKVMYRFSCHNVYIVLNIKSQEETKKISHGVGISRKSIAGFEGLPMGP